MSIFGRSKQDSTEVITSNREKAALPPAPRSTISGGTKIIGDIISNDHMQIDGEQEGTLKIKNHVVVGKSGRVNANMTVNSLQVFGRIVGNIVSSGKVVIEQSGYIEGDIKAPKLVISEGAVFRGNIDMSGDNRSGGSGGDKLNVKGNVGLQDAVSDV